MFSPDTTCENETEVPSKKVGPAVLGGVLGPGVDPTMVVGTSEDEPEPEAADDVGGDWLLPAGAGLGPCLPAVVVAVGAAWSPGVVGEAAGAAEAPVVVVEEVATEVWGFDPETDTITTAAATIARTAAIAVAPRRLVLIDANNLVNIVASFRTLLAAPRVPFKVGRANYSKTEC